jgi:hypothetical protein
LPEAGILDDKETFVSRNLTSSPWVPGVGTET